MSWYILEKLQIDDRNQATLEEMYKFTTLWECICGTCILCQACIDVAHAINSQDEEE